MSEMEDYKQEFLQEAREYLDVMNQNFIQVEKGDVDAINEIFRVAHTIKGMAGFMGYKNLEELCHVLESTMGKIRDGVIAPSSEVVDVLLQAVDKIAEILDRVEEADSDDVEVDDVIAALRKLAEERGEEHEADAGEVEVEVSDANLKLKVVLSEDCVMKSVRAALILESLSEVADIKATIPPENALDSGNFESFTVFLKGEAAKIEEVMSRIAEIEKFEIEELRGELKEADVDKSAQKEESKPVGKKGDEHREKRRTESIRVDITLLDTIMNLVGELVISKGRLLQIASKYDIPELKEAVGVMDRSITSLQDEIMRIRMVKVERVFSKFPRMVRDLARKLGKKVEFEMEGLDTELDRTVLDEISDPLIHLIRNAVDHGIESPEERVAAGKSEVGKIRLAAWRDRNNVIIEIEDDGRGIDVEKVKKKAIERGIISEAQAEKMSEEELKMLIFAPGFSTKDAATEVSGRGVGMDVVKSTVEKLGGSIKLVSEKGRGTKIRISLPPTVAIIKSLLVRVGDETYAIPISSVVEALYVTEDNWKVIHGNPFLIVRGKLIPAFRLRELFNVKNGSVEREVGIIVEKEGEKYALIADAISDQQEIVIKPLSSFLAKIRGFSGITILGDGRVVPIIDVSSLLGGDKLG